MPDPIAQDTLFFFDGMPRELALYEHLARRLLTRYPEADIRVKKTQIGFYDPRLFCCVSLTPVRPRAQRPPRFITVTFGLDAPLDSPRLVCVPVRPNRFTHHALVGDVNDIDEALLGWIDASHQLIKERTR